MRLRISTMPLMDHDGAQLGSAEPAREWIGVTCYEHGFVVQLEPL
jgi:hypothetical protein